MASTVEDTRREIIETLEYLDIMMKYIASEQNLEVKEAYWIRSKDGRHVLLEPLVAKANLLAALVNLNKSEELHGHS